MRMLDEHALAHRISYFLWSSVPDFKLWSLAAEGKLRANLRDEVKRMIHDPKIDQFVENFCGQWLQLRDLNLSKSESKAISLVHRKSAKCNDFGNGRIF